MGEENGVGAGECAGLMARETRDSFSHEWIRPRSPQVYTDITDRTQADDRTRFLDRESRRYREWESQNICLSVLLVVSNVESICATCGERQSNPFAVKKIFDFLKA
jgi:hypothetical protein